jgi:hypothetical protein
VFLIIAYARNCLGGLYVYPSLAVLRSSLTVLIVGVLAHSVRRFGGVESVQVQAVVVFIGMVWLEASRQMASAQG